MSDQVGRQILAGFPGTLELLLSIRGYIGPLSCNIVSACLSPPYHPASSSWRLGPRVPWGRAPAVRLVSGASYDTPSTQPHWRRRISA